MSDWIGLDWIAELFGRASSATRRTTWKTLNSTWSTSSSASQWRSHCRTFAASSAKLLVFSLQSLVLAPPFDSSTLCPKKRTEKTSKFALFSLSGLKDEKLMKKQTYVKTETCRLYSRVF